MLTLKRKMNFSDISLYILERQSKVTMRTNMREEHIK